MRFTFWHTKTEGTSIVTRHLGGGMEILFGRFSGLFYSAIGALIAARLAIHTPLFWGVSAVLLTLTLIGIRD